MIHVCVPVLKRYDLLAKLVASLPAEGVSLHIVNNGQDDHKLHEALGDRLADVFLSNVPLGVAASWNWFIENVPEERVISNDDIEFAPDSLQKLIAPQADAVFAQGIGFSCFVLRNSCVKKIGVFDESISPGYAYYEDEDYMARMRRGGVVAVDVDCGATHVHSATLSACSVAEEAEHHRKFHIARMNFVAKWGMMPGDLFKQDLEALRK